MNVVGMVSSYREGRLAAAAIDSLRAVGLDRLYIYEGPAGPPLETEAAIPETQFPAWVYESEAMSIDRPSRRSGVHVHRGRWRTDARKRNEILQQAKSDFPDGPLWAVVVDADEVLVNGAYLRDRLEWILWQDALKPDQPPYARWPLRLVEHDGSISLIGARVFRADLLRSIDHSSSLVTNERGVQEGWGNEGEMSAVWIEGWMRAVDAGHMIAWPPLPCEPHLVHRSNLRHPLRAGLRMSEQETIEFAKAQAAEKASKDSGAQTPD